MGNPVPCKPRQRASNHWFDSKEPSTAEMKSDNLQYNTLGRLVARIIDQVSDGPSIILID